MTADDYRQYVVNAALLANMAAQIPVTELLTAIEHDAVGPIVDPTLYRDRARALEQDRELLEAVAPLAAMGRRLLAMNARRESIADGRGTGV